MYSIRRYFLYALLLYSLIIVAVFVGYRVFVEYPSDIATIEEHQKRELESLAKGLQLNQENLQAIVTDWAHWTDSHEFVLAPSEHQQYVDDNILSSTFETFDLIAIVYFDRNFDRVFSQGYSFEEEEMVDAKTILEFPLGNAFRNRIAPGERWEGTGWMSTSEGPAAFAVQYITDSNEEAPPSGYLMFVQAITQSQIENLQAITRLQLSFKPTSLEDSETFGVVSLSTPQLVEGFQLERKRLLDDFTGTPIMLLSITHDPLTIPVLMGWSEVLILLLLLAVPAVLMLAVDRSLIRPLWRNTTQISSMVKKGNLEELPQQLPVLELEQMRKAFNKSVQLVNEQQKTLEALSMTDGLTGIANRRAFDQKAQQSWHSCLRQKDSFLLATLDLDYFKSFNDSLGHPAGDDALKAVAQVLAGFCRRSSELCARIGGEEFALVITGEETADAEQRLHNLRQEISALSITHPASPVAEVLTCSIGALFISSPNEDYRALTLSELLSLVDKELYRAKQQGRNRLSFQCYRLPEPE
ncbi:diguanylate cyclase [Lacimicrobium sp. SS2-24]|uniref:sensor domain-containing diguanylate cyclase n=1 Tax=Lacimicrobium sp. SS2-24 TaxID=2005569 RepID=UPI0014393D92|nr:diguanylate cyclase [Lacimicrobium sp. SS2-24]